jgi:hypothetical protein
VTSVATTSEPAAPATTPAPPATTPVLSANDPDPPAGNIMPSVPPPTIEAAGADHCTVDTPSDIDSIRAPRYPGVGKMPAAIVMGTQGGLVLWQAEDETQAFARAIGKDGKPTSPTQRFPVRGSVLVKESRAFSGGFAVVMSHFVVSTLETTYWLYIVGSDGSPRGRPTQLAMSGFVIETASDMVADRFVVFVGPDQSKGTRRSRALLFRIEASGDVKQKVMDFEISAPIAVRPSVELAMSATHWAALVDVGTGGSQTITIGDKTYETKPLVKPDADAKATHDIIVDGKLIRYDQSVDDRSRPRRIAWSGDTLATVTADGRFGRIEAGGAFVADPKLRSAFRERIEADFIAGGGDGTIVSRRNRAGERVGQPLHLDGAQTGIGPDTNELAYTWAGDRFLFAYPVDQGGRRTVRVVGVRCNRSKKT